MAVRFCRQCGKPLEAKPREKPSNFAKRRFCGTSCANRYKRANWTKNRVLRSRPLYDALRKLDEDG